MYKNLCNSSRGTSFVELWKVNTKAVPKHCSLYCYMGHVKPEVLFIAISNSYVLKEVVIANSCNEPMKLASNKEVNTLKCMNTGKLLRKSILHMYFI